MAKNVTPQSVSYTCDCCGCTCMPAVSAQGIKKNSALGPVKSFSLDLCDECHVEFETWLASQKIAHGAP